MTSEIESLDDLDDKQLTALVELAEAFQSGRVRRRDIIKLVGVGGISGLLGAGISKATNREKTSAQNDTGEATSEPEKASPEAIYMTEVSSAPGDSEYDSDQAVLFNMNGNPYWRSAGESVIDLSADKSYVASPGEVQTAIDAMELNNGGLVRLDPRRQYEQPATPWEIKQDVILDFNGAVLHGTGDLNSTDIIRLYPGAQVHTPRINLYDSGDGYTMSNGYQANVFSLDTEHGFHFARGTSIQNGHLTAVGETGTACYLGVTRKTSAITHLDLNFDIGIPGGSDAEASIGTALHLDTQGAKDDGFINGVRVSGNWRYPVVGVLQTGVTSGDPTRNQQNYNRFDVQIQGGERAEAAWQIKDSTWAAYNRWYGMWWDLGNFSQNAWVIESKFQDADKTWRGCKNNAVFTPSGTVSSNVTNDSPNDHRVNEMWRMRSVRV